MSNNVEQSAVELFKLRETLSKLQTDWDIILSNINQHKIMISKLEKDSDDLRFEIGEINSKITEIETFLRKNI